MASAQKELITILDEKVSLENRLSSLTYGSIEVRENKEYKYIYVHFREDGLRQTKYVGEYSDELYNLILKNNIESKQLKKEIRKLNKSLKELNYKDSELSSSVQINIDFARKNLADTIYMTKEFSLNNIPLIKYKNHSLKYFYIDSGR